MFNGILKKIHYSGVFEKLSTITEPYGSGVFKKLYFSTVCKKLSIADESYGLDVFEVYLKNYTIVVYLKNFLLEMGCIDCVFFGNVFCCAFYWIIFFSILLISITIH